MGLTAFVVLVASTLAALYGWMCRVAMYDHHRFDVLAWFAYGVLGAAGVFSSGFGVGYFAAAEGVVPMWVFFTVTGPMLALFAGYTLQFLRSMPSPPKDGGEDQ